MAKSTQSKRVWNWLWPLLLVSLACGVIAILLVHLLLDTLPEKELAKDFLRANPRAIAFLGEVLCVSHGSGGSKKVERFHDRLRNLEKH
ncbi:MAG: hypothetical protein ACYS21_06510 [Planctomycetota bacterium]|jgi:hypothetical protein